MSQIIPLSTAANPEMQLANLLDAALLVQDGFMRQPARYAFHHARLRMAAEILRETHERMQTFIDSLPLPGSAA